MTIPNTKKNYIIGSGWWCDEDQSDRHKIGDNYIRSSEFHKLWYKAIDTFTDPAKIFIVDSASPVSIPVNINDKRIEVVHLLNNPGHPTKHNGKYSGWTVSALMGLEYALHCDVDYFVYIEQDALIYGNGIIEKSIEKMNKPYMFGSADGSCHPLQQSFFIVHRSKIEELINNIHNINAPDYQVSPEKKFCIATSPVLRFLPLSLFIETRHYSERRWIDRQLVRFHRNMLRIFKNFDILPVGPGGYKTRGGIDFDTGYFYFQHGEYKEIEQYITKYESEYGVLGDVTSMQALAK
jgi:hypothetical protein